MQSYIVIFIHNHEYIRLAITTKQTIFELVAMNSTILICLLLISMYHTVGRM
jgi:hypothetical protein